MGAPQADSSTHRRGDTRALYLHVPFCSSTCPYCDFTSVTVHDRVDDYVAALCHEIRAQAAGAELDTVFIGGGTPSLLAPGQIGPVMDAVHDACTLASGYEWTIEANPGTATEARAACWRAGGVNRVSIGAQSFDAAVLQTLGRRHTPGAIRRAAGAVRDAGTDNVNLDLMYGVPGQDMRSWRDTIQSAIDLAPTHISAYHLTIEPATPFGAAAAAGRFSEVDDEAVLRQRCVLEEMLSAAGHAAYEISNYALPGHACRHNLTYWRHEPYFGLGAGAVGFDGVTRTRNFAAVDAYIGAVRATGSGVGSSETLDADTLMFEEILTGLRLREGLDTERFERRHGHAFAERHGEQLRPLVDGGLVEMAPGRVRLTPRGVPVANEVALRFLR